MSGNLQPLQAFESVITLNQSGSFSNPTGDVGFGKSDCCWPDDPRNCDQYRATFDYNNAEFSNDIRSLKSLTIDQIYDQGLISSVISKWTFNFTNCGADCDFKNTNRTRVEYEFIYIDNTVSSRQECYQKGVDPYATEAGSCVVVDRLKPIKSFYSNLNREPGACNQYGIKDVSYLFETRIVIDMKKYCKNINLESAICTRFCSYDENSTDCYNSFLNYCFTRLKDGKFPITNRDSQCFQFLSAYAGNQNTNITELDNKIKTLCKESSIDPSNYVNLNLPVSEQTVFTDLCACHFEDQIYDRYYQSLLEQIPNLSISGQGTRRCVFPYCNVSPFKSSEMKGTGTCPSIQCLQSIRLNNNGTINGDINAQTNANCTSEIQNNSGSLPSPPITPVPPTPSPNSAKTSYNWLYWILGLLGLLLLILIVIFIIKKMNQKNVQILPTTMKKNQNTIN